MFRVDAGAPENALRVNTSGNVGIGTDAAALAMHIRRTDTPAIRLEQTGGGFTAQTWDIGANEANFFVRDQTNGSLLPFRIRPGAPTSSLDIGADGSIRFAALTNCSNGIGSSSNGTLSCIAAAGSSLVAQAGPGQPITVGITTDGTTVNVAGTAGNRTVSGVAAGALTSGSTEAVNGAQLFTANQRVAAAFGGGAGLDGTGQLTAPSYTVQGVTFDNVGGALAALNSAVAGGTAYFASNGSGPAATATGSNALAAGSGAAASGQNAIALGVNSQATQSGSIALGMNSASTGTNAIAIGTGASATGSVAVGAGAAAAAGGAAFGDGAQATGTNSTAIGPGAVATAPNSVAIGSGSVASQPNTVSFGTPGNPRRLTNVAPGVEANDAATFGQLSSIASGLQSQLNAVDQNSRRGIAATAAMTSAPMPSAAGRTAWAVNTAFHRGETGLGVSIAHRLAVDVPLAITAGYGNAGGDGHVGRVGLQGEF